MENEDEDLSIHVTASELNVRFPHALIDLLDLRRIEDGEPVGALWVDVNGKLRNSYVDRNGMRHEDWWDGGGWRTNAAITLLAS